MNRTPIICTTIGTLGLLGSAALLTGGPLDPPAGPVAPTYKTLAEVEPRIAISAVNTPGDATSIYKITSPGSYYLTGNVTAGQVGRSVIVVAAPNVTIDLCGFTIDGRVASGGRSTFGIVLDLDTFTSNFTVRNGTIRDCGTGVFVSSGIGNGEHYLVEDVKLLENGIGLFALSRGTVRSCEASRNEQEGLDINSGLVESCIVASNGGTGVDAGNGCVVRNCLVAQNGLRGISGSNALVSSCVTSGNVDTGMLLNRSIVEGCRTTDGLELDDLCVARGNACSHPDNTAMLVSGSDNRIEGNIFTGSSIGLGVIDPGNIIIRNTASGNTINWTIVAGNAVAPIVQASTNASNITGNAYAGSLGNMDPNANFTY